MGKPVGLEAVKREAARNLAGVEFEGFAPELRDLVDEVAGILAENLDGNPDPVEAAKMALSSGATLSVACDKWLAAVERRFGPFVESEPT